MPWQSWALGEEGTWPDTRQRPTRAQVRQRRHIAVAILLAAAVSIVLIVMVWRGVVAGSTTTLTIAPRCGPVGTGQVAWDNFAHFQPEPPIAGGHVRVVRRWWQSTQYAVGLDDGTYVAMRPTTHPRTPLGPSCP